MTGWLKGVSGAVIQFVAVLTALTSVGLWTWGKVEAQAQEYVEQLIAPKIDDLAAQIESLATQIEAQTQAVESVTTGQDVEASQSVDEAEVNRQILCLLQKLDPDAPPTDDCQELE